jgi:hypothetical protein
MLTHNDIDGLRIRSNESKQIGGRHDPVAIAIEGVIHGKQLWL